MGGTLCGSGRAEQVLLAAHGDNWAQGSGAKRTGRDPGNVDTWEICAGIEVPLGNHGDNPRDSRAGTHGDPLRNEDVSTGKEDTVGDGNHKGDDVAHDDGMGADGQGEEDRPLGGPLRTWAWGSALYPITGCLLEFSEPYKTPSSPKW